MDSDTDSDSDSNPMAALYHAEYVHIAQTWTWIPIPYFCVEQESEYESIPEPVSGNVNEPFASEFYEARSHPDDMT